MDDKDFMDSIFLRIKQDDFGRIISNRIVEDYDREFTILLKCCNGIHIPSRDLEFSKSVITEKNFIVVSKVEEELLNKLNKRVVKSDSGFRQIANVEDIQDADWELLFDKGYISAIHESTVDSKITAVEVSDKAFYYFDYKSRYHPENTNNNNGEN